MAKQLLHDGAEKREAYDLRTGENSADLHDWEKIEEADGNVGLGEPVGERDRRYRDRGSQK